MLRFRSPVPSQQRLKNEGGYMLATSAVIVLIIVALVSSYAFVMKRQSHFLGNYAAGERIANLAKMSHFYAQTQAYSGPSSTLADFTDIYPSLNLPDNFSFPPVEGTKFSVEIMGVNNAPLGATILLAASAYMHIRIRPLNGVGRPPSDDIALQAGASKYGMQRMGYYQTAIDPTDQCDGAPTEVRWGPESTACLNNAQIFSILQFTDVQKGDLIVPVWETAMAQELNKYAILRYPQPERTLTNTMQTNIDMGGFKIINARNVDSNKINAATSLGETANLQGNLLVKTTSGFNAQTTLAGGANIYGGSGTTMQVSGPVVMDGGNMMATQKWDNTANVVVSNPVIVDKLGTDTQDILVKSPDGGPMMSAGISNIVNPLKDLNITDPAGKLAVAGNLNVQRLNAGSQLDIYAAQLNTTGTAQVTSNTWNIRSIEQKGSDGTHHLTVSHVKVDNCFGNACPPPEEPGGGL